MAERPVPAPENFTSVWHRGDFSIMEVYTRQIRKGYPDGGSYHRVEYARDEEHQLPEEVFRGLYLRAIALCAVRPDLVVSVCRTDKEDEVPENDNNRPFIMESSPRYFPGAEVKDIVYEGTVYHADSSQIHSFSESYMEQAQRIARPAIEHAGTIVLPSKPTRKEKKKMRRQGRSLPVSRGLRYPSPSAA